MADETPNSALGLTSPAAVRVSAGGTPEVVGGTFRSDGGKTPQVVGDQTPAVVGADGKPVTLDKDGKPVVAAAPVLDKDGKPVPPEVVPPVVAEKTYTPEQQAAIADPKLGKFTKSFIDNGDLTPAEITEAATAVGVPEDMVKGYLEGQKALLNAGKPDAAAVELQQQTEANAKVAFEFSKDFAGWQNFAAWSQQNMTAEERSTVESAVTNAHANPAAARIIIGNFFGKFQAAAGTAPRNVLNEAQHGAGAHVADGFKSQAEMVTAMNDPRYNRDPAYTKEVTDKVAVSNWQ